MNTRFLETFVWVTRLKSFRAAAEKLNTTQPNISSRITALETQFGAKLYERGTKEFQPTAAGRRLFDYAVRICEISGEMQKELTVAEADNRLVRIGVIELVTLSWLPRFIELVRGQEALLEVDIVNETTAELVGSLRRGDIDLAFVWGPANEAEMESKYICSYATGWMGSPAFAPAGRPMDVVDLSRLPLVSSKEGASDRAFVHEYFAAYGMEEPQRATNRVSLSSYSLATSQQLIRSGLAVMAMAPFLMAEDIAAGRAVVLPVEQKLPPVCLTACYNAVGASTQLLALLSLACQAAGEYAAEAHPDHYWV